MTNWLPHPGRPVHDLRVSGGAASSAEFGEGFDHFGWGLDHFDQHSFSGDREFRTRFRMQEGYVEACCSFADTTGAKRTPLAVSHSTAFGRSSIHRPT